MDQELWNTLFGWITGKQCFVPEGCPSPAEGILVYISIIVVVALVAYIERNQLLGALWRK